MSENKRQSETDVAINVKSYGSVATYSGAVALSKIALLQIYC